MIWPENADEERKRFGERVARIRRIRRMRREDLARRIGKSPYFVVALELGKRRVSREIVRKLSDALAVSEEFLVSGVGEFSIPTKRGEVSIGCRGS